MSDDNDYPWAVPGYLPAMTRSSIATTSNLILGAGGAGGSGYTTSRMDKIEMELDILKKASENLLKAVNLSKKVTALFHAKRIDGTQMVNLTDMLFSDDLENLVVAESVIENLMKNNPINTDEQDSDQ